jgi:signal transduction histidine kinase
MVLSMSSLESIYKIMADSLEQNGQIESLHEAGHKFDSGRHISPAVAHELNNILTIIQGYADCLLVKHGEDPVLQPPLKMIAEATRRASMLVRDTRPPNPTLPLRHNLPPPPPAT